MEQIAHNVPSNGLQLRTRATEPAASVPSSSSDEQSSGTRNPARRRSLPASKGTKNPPAKINTSHTATKGTKAVSAGPRSGTSHGAIMQMSGTLSPAHEVTYTPTTHRISKAKKGKKVHACEFPGCTKACRLLSNKYNSRHLLYDRSLRGQSTESKASLSF